MNDKIIISLVVIIGLPFSFLLTLYLIRAPSPPPLRQDEVLTRDKLRSSLAKQPLSEGSEYIIFARRGHKEGHILMTVPTKLAPGEYAYEIRARQKAKKDSLKPSCIMDVLSGEKLLKASPLPFRVDRARVDFELPAWGGHKLVQARLYCEGKVETAIERITFIKNPAGVPAVIVQE